MSSTRYSGQIRVAGLVGESIVDGPGLRFAVFAQGCAHSCPGCHNPHTHDPEGGRLEQVENIIEQIAKNPLLDGVTLTGGEPFLQAKELLPIAKYANENRLDLLIYTGHLWEDIIAENNPEAMALLACADIMIDGRFELAKRRLSMPYKGSENQRIINVRKSLEQGRVVVYNVDSNGNLT